MSNIRLFWAVIRRCHFEKFLFGFLISVFGAAGILLAVEPEIDRYGDALWYTFVSCTTIGYGDVVCTTFIGRALTVYITVYEIILAALLSGVIVSHYLELLHRREEKTAIAFLDKMKRLTELSPEELQEIQDKARKIDR